MEGAGEGRGKPIGRGAAAARLEILYGSSVGLPKRVCTRPADLASGKYLVDLEGEKLVGVRGFEPPAPASRSSALL